MAKASTEIEQPVWRFLAHLRERNLRMWNEAGRLRVSAPPGVLTPELRQELTQRKAEILDFLRDARTLRPPVEKAPRDEPLPLSFAQERLWRNERNAASQDNLNVIVSELNGNLNTSALERSFQELVRRHEVFRTTFHAIGETPVQLIASSQPIKLNIVDLSRAKDPEAETASFAFKEKAEPVSLEQGPLMRFSVLRLGLHCHRLVMRLHHILYDIWSFPIFCRELDLLYTSFCEGKESPLPELRIQMADFAVWQRRYLAPDSQAFQGQLAFWKKQLSGVASVLRLPCERPSELKTASLADVSVSFTLSQELSTSLGMLTRREGATCYMTFLAALTALINLSTGQNDIVLGTYMAKRSGPECEGMMGYFSDVGVLRANVSSHLGFLELLSRTREMVLDAQSHDDMPLNLLLEELTKCNGTQLDIRAIFTFETFREGSNRLGDLEVRPVAIAFPKTMPWRFQMRVRDQGEVFSGLVMFDARLHDPYLVRRMVRNYVRLLEAVVRKPGVRLCVIEEELGSW